VPSSAGAIVGRAAPGIASPRDDELDCVVGAGRGERHRAAAAELAGGERVDEVGAD
jgi:hypothetical protein